jgi:hypothetical protein
MTIQPNNAAFNAATGKAAPAAPANILSSKAMLANLSITQWTARKLDKRVTSATNAAHGAAHNAGNYNKALIAGDALAKIITAANEARAAHYKWTLPWADSGARILPSAAYVQYTRELRELREAFEKAVAEFVANYPQFVEEAKRRLGDMYQATDYPETEEIARRFSYAVRMYQVPVANDFRAEIADSEAAAIRAEMEILNRDALAGAVKDAWERVAETVGHMAAKLGEFKPASDGNKASGIFRDSLVENVRALAKILPSLNISNDPNLDSIAARIDSELCRFSADDLRESDVNRVKVREAAASIVSQVSAFI